MCPAQLCDISQDPEVTGISGGKVNVSPTCPLTSWDPNDSEGLWTRVAGTHRLSEKYRERGCYSGGGGSVCSERQCFGSDNQKEPR